MKRITKKYRDEILSKEQLLENARIKLKEEFVGIDIVIDEVINTISSWFLFPDLQERPVVVNLWGLTGTGKTALINRLTYYLKWGNKCYNFDLRESKNRVDKIENILADIYSNGNGEQLIITLDEFQHARTIDDLGKEIEETPNSIIWELVDSGKFQISPDYNTLSGLYSLTKKIKYFLHSGMKVSSGIVITNKQLYVKELMTNFSYVCFNERKGTNPDEDVLVIPESYYSDILSYTKNKYSTERELQEKLKTMDGNETIKFLQEVLDLSLSPRVIDCSKSLIFVIGNLDDAYQMSANFNPDISADEFHESSLEINISHIKSALKNRFRSEQIARLGNSHIIYPAFSTETFYKIIDLELNKIITKVYDSQNIKLVFDKTIKEIIYKEGVYPTQGARPLFTTIHNIIATKLGKIIVEIIIKNLEADKVKLSYKSNKIDISYFYRDTFVHKIEAKQTLKLESLRENKNDALQAITAVHESGHAICSVFLMNTLPNIVHSITANAGSSGSTQINFNWDYVSKKEILNRVAVMLGGFVAEQVVFGKDNLTTGSESDIKKATKFVTDMIKDSGMGDLPAQFHNQDFQTKYHVYDDDVNNMAKIWIDNAVKLATDTLQKEEYLLLQMSVYLSDNVMMNKDLIEEYCSLFSKNYNHDQLIKNEKLQYYRNHLLQKAASYNNENNNVPNHNFKLCLNKDNASE